MIEKLNGFKGWIATLLAGLSAFLGFRGILFVAMVVLMCIDFAMGWVCAMKSGNWKSAKAREGICHKVGMLAVAVVSAIMDTCLQVVCALLPDFSFAWINILFPLVVSWYILTEFGSIVENAALLGAPIPSWLLGLLEVGKKVLESVSEKNFEKSEKN